MVITVAFYKLWPIWYSTDLLECHIHILYHAWTPVSNLQAEAQASWIAYYSGIPI